MRTVTRDVTVAPASARVLGCRRGRLYLSRRYLQTAVRAGSSGTQVLRLREHAGGCLQTALLGVVLLVLVRRAERVLEEIGVPSPACTGRPATASTVRNAPSSMVQAMGQAAGQAVGPVEERARRLQVHATTFKPKAGAASARTASFSTIRAPTQGALSLFGSFAGVKSCGWHSHSTVAVRQPV